MPGSAVDLQLFGWDGGGFAGGDHARYGFDGGTWHKATAQPA